VKQVLALDRGGRALVNLELPENAGVPENYVYVPSGRFLFGSADDEGSRRGFFDTVPLHAIELPGFLIARTEVTYGDYLAFLDDLPPAERARRTPSVPAKAGSCAMKLEHTLRGWRLTIQPARDEYSALAGEPIRYRGRKELAVQDWRRFPVTGVSAEDAEAYAAWLRSHGVPRARLCSEYEWERAARGADDRIYPHGNLLSPGDADYDESHGKEAMGPDVVGAHPRSASAFGVLDLSGNAYEWVSSSLNAGQYVARGGSFFHDAKTVEVVNRTVSVATLRDATLGMRICAALR
jgi:formylglycine-generating enzyme required for sulfatase activity